ncbi:5637_t:CDS:2, partial [Rhizophagus irregularis]
MPIIIVHVVFNSKTVFEWEGLPVNKDMNIQEFFKDVVVDKLNPELWEKNCVAYFSHTKIGETEKIGLECNAWETVNQCGKYVTFKLLNDSNEIPSMNTINAFELMRSASMHNYLPEFKLPAKNFWEQLRIDLNELIRSNGGGWIGKDNANNIGKKFVTDLAKSIWCVDICSYKTFNERFKIPALFTNFFDQAHPEKYKSSRRSFDSEELQRHYKILMNYIELPWMEKPKFAWLKEPLLLYANNLLNQRVITARNQSSLTPVVDEEKAGYIEILDENTWRKPEVVKEFRILTKTLEELEYWEPVNINLFCPVLRKQRFRFVEKLKVAFPFKVGKYTYHHGNIKNSVYVWRIGINVNEQDMINKHYTIRNNLKQTLQVYHTRAMRKEFLDTVELYIGKVEKARMRYIYSVWLQDSAASINSETQDIDDRVEVMFELGDPDLITDFREINEGRLPKYDVFWEYSSKYLEGIAQESEMAILLRMNSWLIFMDDKHRCKVGEPGYPVAAVERGRQVIVSKNKAFKVTDHDFTKCGIIPSCGAIDCNICKPIRSDELDFSQVHSLPDPVPIADKTNYKQFEDVYGTITTEQYRPSLLNQQQKKKRAHIEFGPTAQFVRNVGIVIECCECNKWRVLYSKSKLSPFEVSILERYLDTIQYTCGDSFEALVENVEQNESNINGDENSEHDYVGEIFKKVKVDDGLICNNPTEISYYSSGLFEEICFQCGKVPEDECDESDRPNLNEGFYYYCDECHTTVSSKKKR